MKIAEHVVTLAKQGIAAIRERVKRIIYAQILVLFVKIQRPVSVMQLSKDVVGVLLMELFVANPALLARIADMVMFV